MIGRGSFQVEVNSNNDGPVVTVTHTLSQQCRSARPRLGESCHRVEDRLISEITRTFLNLDDFQFEVGRAERNGQIYGFYRVTHRPSNRSKMADTITTPKIGQLQSNLLDELLDELWSDGLLPLKMD